MAQSKTYSITLLRNIKVKNLTKIGENCIGEFPAKFRAKKGEGQEKINRIIKEERKKNNHFNEESLEESLFNHLVYDGPDHSYIRKLYKEKNDDVLKQYIKKHPAYNRKINSSKPMKDDIISIRITGNKIGFLITHGTIRVKDNKRVNLVSSCILDLKRNIIINKTTKRFLDKSDQNVGSILTKTANNIREIVDRNINIYVFNANFLQETIYKIFKDDSIKAEEEIKTEIENTIKEDELKNKIREFLTHELKLKSPEKHLEKTLSIYYQDFSELFQPTQFGSGFVFAFGFLDKQYTKSSTRDMKKKKDPIYKKDIYWTLKDYIYKLGSLDELAVHWRFNKNDYTENYDLDTLMFVELNLKEFNRCLEIHYYNSDEIKRGVKEEYVLRKIKKYLLAE